MIILEPPCSRDTQTELSQPARMFSCLTRVTLEEKEEGGVGLYGEDERKFTIIKTCYATQQAYETP